MKKLTHCAQANFVILFLITCVLNPACAANQVQQLTPSIIKLLPETEGIGGENSNFGGAAAIDGDLALIAAPNMKGTGVIYAYHFNGGDWNLIQTIHPEPSYDPIGREFGGVIQISGNKALIGSGDYYSNYLAFVNAYEFISGEWHLTQIISPTDPYLGGRFGVSLALDGDRAVIGRPDFYNQELSSQGAVYYFEYINGLWTEKHVLFPEANSFNAGYGQELALNGDDLIIGRSNYDSGQVEFFAYQNDEWQLVFSDVPNQFDGYLETHLSLVDDGAVISAASIDEGLVYTYSKSINGDWSFDQQIMAPVGSDNFGDQVVSHDNVFYIGDSVWSGADHLFTLFQGMTGWELAAINTSEAVEFESNHQSLAVALPHVILGQPDYDDNYSNDGKAVAFSYDGSLLSKESDLFTGEFGSANDHFGHAVAQSGDVMIVSAPEDDEQSNNAGVVYVFEKENNDWVMVQKLFNPLDGYANFGASVVIEGGTIAIFGGDNQAGSVFVFEQNNGVWEYTETLIPSEGVLGSSLVVDDGKILISSGNAYSANSLPVFLFEKQNDSWIESFKFTHDFGGVGYGFSISMNDNKVAIFAANDGQGGDKNASLYQLVNGNWQLFQRILFDGFSTGRETLSISENELLVYVDEVIKSYYRVGNLFQYYHSISSFNDIYLGTTPFAFVNDESQLIIYSDFFPLFCQAFIYKKEDLDWVPFYIQSTPDCVQGQGFGRVGDGANGVVSLEGQHMLIGSNKDNDRGTGSGSAYMVVLDLIYSSGFE